ncbi:MAG: hypothetical protein PHT60_05245 [Acidiphilium sp.]|nr:hypothetical protein [Acidiphilium sp.]MDD4935169.1 hypothetical protein [Acidiphilium sp.]
MEFSTVTEATERLPHPNDVDRKRIERALEARMRYRYVAPRVLAVAGGYRIESPCCSRNIDTEGGVIDVALIAYQTDTKTWCLYQKNHAQDSWTFENSYCRLNEALEQLNTDPERKFWQ